MQGAKKIESLLDKAKEFIPKQYWARTPLVLKATAGLRLLLPVEAENLLNEVRDVFLHSGFAVKDDAVEIMHGIDEGIYSWFTINFLLSEYSSTLELVKTTAELVLTPIFFCADRLGTKNTVAALDLGGGSIQVSFTPKDVYKTPLLAEHIHTVATPSGKIDVFTNSYLGLGLQAVRHAVYTHGNSGDNTKLESVCVNPIVQSNPFKYGTKVYTLR